MYVLQTRFLVCPSIALVTAAVELHELKPDDHILQHDFRSSKEKRRARTSDCLYKELHYHSHKLNYLIRDLEIDLNLKYSILHHNVSLF